MTARHAEGTQATQGTQGTEVVRVCMICRREIGARNQALGLPLAPARNHSHGVCLGCAPGYCQSLGLDKENTERVLAHVRD